MKATHLSTIRHLGSLALGLLLLTACGAAAPTTNLSSQGAAPQSGVANAPSAPEAKGGSVSDTTASSQIAARLIVRNATLTLIVKDTLAQMADISKMTNELNGFVAGSSSHKYEEGVQATMTLRIPADKLDTALARLHGLATEVRDEQVSGQDVTAEYTDLGAQLRNLEAAELQLREIMSKTERTEDVLSVYNQLTQKRGEIEQVKGRIQYLSQSAAMATINLTLIPDQLAQPVQVAGWHPEGVLKSAVEALIGGLQTVATIGIWLVVVVLPIGLIIASPFIVLIVLIRRRNKRKQPTLPTPAKQA